MHGDAQLVLLWNGVGTEVLEDGRVAVELVVIISVKMVHGFVKGGQVALQ